MGPVTSVGSYQEGLMTQARKPRRFGSTEHLASEAIAAYVDGELRMNAYLRASHHLSMCPECAAEVDSQQQARHALRRAAEVSMPSSLLGALSRIPLCFEEQYPPEVHPDDRVAGRGGRGLSFDMDRHRMTSRRWSLPWRR